MQKNYSFIFTAVCFLLLQQTNAQTCDTINMPVPPSWSAITYAGQSPFGPSGYLNGTNATVDSAKANYFDLSSSSFTHILGVIVKFGKANSNVAANLNKLIGFSIYSDAGGLPGTLLASVQKPLQDIKTDVLAGVTTNINFPAPVAMPAGKKFYMAVEISNFNCCLNPKKDSVWVAGTASGEVIINTAWNKQKNGDWESFEDSYNDPLNPGKDLKTTLWIFPYVSNGATGCTALPVHLISFNAARKNNDAVINWQVSNEINMRSYDLERSANDGIFKTIQSIMPVNGLKEQTYSTTDKNIFTSGLSASYRLKQTDADGSIKYSRVVTLRSDKTVGDIIVPNPFAGELKIQISFSQPVKLSVQLFDMQGKLLLKNPAIDCAASVNTISLKGSAALHAGVYVLKLNAGAETYIYKLVKE